MDFYIAIKNGKVVEQIKVPEGEEPRWSLENIDLNKKKVTRLGDLESEIYDKDLKDWIEEPGAKARKADRDCGKEHINNAHNIKTIEAMMFRAGLNIDGGMISSEALQKEIPISEMVDIVWNKVKEIIDKETVRRTAKI